MITDFFTEFRIVLAQKSWLDNGATEGKVLVKNSEINYQIDGWEKIVFSFVVEDKTYCHNCYMDSYFSENLQEAYHFIVDRVEGRIK